MARLPRRDIVEPDGHLSTRPGPVRGAIVTADGPTGRQSPLVDPHWMSQSAPPSTLADEVAQWNEGRTSPAAQRLLAEAGQFDADLGRAFFQIRQMLRMTVPALARRLRCTPDVIDSLEAGAVSDLPTDGELARLIDLYAQAATIMPDVLVARLSRYRPALPSYFTPVIDGRVDPPVAHGAFRPTHGRVTDAGHDARAPAAVQPVSFEAATTAGRTEPDLDDAGASPPHAAPRYSAPDAPMAFDPRPYSFDRPARAMPGRDLSPPPGQQEVRISPARLVPDVTVPAAGGGLAEAPFYGDTQNYVTRGRSFDASPMDDGAVAIMPYGHAPSPAPPVSAASEPTLVGLPAFQTQPMLHFARADITVPVQPFHGGEQLFRDPGSEGGGPVADVAPPHGFDPRALAPPPNPSAALHVIVPSASTRALLPRPSAQSRPGAVGARTADGRLRAAGPFWRARMTQVWSRLRALPTRIKIGGVAMLIGLVVFVAGLWPATLYRVVSVMPEALQPATRRLVDPLVTILAPRRGGLTWIDVGDPRLRKGGRLRPGER